MSMPAMVLDAEMQVAALRGRVRLLEQKLNEQIGANAWLKEEITKLRDRLSEERTGRMVTEERCVELQQEIAELAGHGGDDDE